MNAIVVRLVTLFALALPLSVVAVAPTPEQILTGIEPGLFTARDFGRSIASSGNFTAIGAPGNATAGVPGSVWIYDRSGGTYALLDVLQAPSPAAGDGFGYHLTFADGQLIVGAPFRTVSGVAAHGEVFVYEQVAGAFTLQQTILPGTAVATNDWFGFHVSADSGWLAIGVPRAAANDRGQVQLYRYDASVTDWIYHSAITFSTNFSRFGTRVLTRGDRVFASAIGEKPSNLAAVAGFVYEYQRSGDGAAASFGQVQRFRPTTFPSTDPVQAFGSSIALSPDASLLLVGAPADEESAGDVRGAAYLFSRVGGSWTQLQRLTSPAGARAESFGISASFGTNTQLVIGDFQETNLASVVAGAAYEYTRPSTAPGQTWSAARSFVNNSGVALDYFGAAVDNGSGLITVGAVGIDESGGVTDVGRGFVFSSLYKDGFE